MPEHPDETPAAGLPKPILPLACLPYAAMRRRWCALALRAFLARWGVYLVVAGAVFGAGTNSALDLILSAAAWLVVPLFWAISHGAWGLLALPLQAVFGAAFVWGARQLLWPAQWAESERALPITAAVSRRSDAEVVLLALLPMALLYAAGAATLLVHGPAWLHGHRVTAVLALVLATAGSAALGVWGLQRRRRWSQRPAAPARKDAAASGPDRQRRAPALRPAANGGWFQPLLLRPLWRGPARRTGWTLAVGALLLLMPAGGLVVLHGGEPWWLALASLLSLLVCTRINHLARLDYAELRAALAPLPLPAQRFDHARRSLGLWPVLPTLALLCGLVLRRADPALRPTVLLAWAVVCLGGCVFEVQSEPVEPGADPASKAGRWLFSLILSICLATEVLS